MGVVIEMEAPLRGLDKGSAKALKNVPGGSRAKKAIPRSGEGLAGTGEGLSETAGPARKPIKDWAPEEQPRERMVMHRSASLSQAELIAIVIRQGSRKHSALELARQLLDRYGDIHSLGKCTPGDLMKTSGIGMAKATTILAALELGGVCGKSGYPSGILFEAATIAPIMPAPGWSIYLMNLLR